MLQGQWIGRLDGDPCGLVVLDADQDGNLFRGSACLFPDDRNIPNTLARLERIEDSFHAKEVPIFPVDHAGRIIGFDNLANVFPVAIHSHSAEISMQRSGNKIAVSFKTSIGTFGQGELKWSDVSKPSRLQPIAKVSDWKTFKEYVSAETAKKHYHVMFRGQPCTRRLRTSFHRTNRSDLDRYIIEDIPLLRRYLSPSMRHFFDMNDPVQVGAFYNLIQHHGYPTPLLDWTYSPYIAAYFAYATADHKETSAVRIFQFESHSWQKNVQPQVPFVANVRPHFSIIELLGIENPRMIPQQALSTLTNIDDVETYIMGYESRMSEQFLSVIDLPIEEQSLALSELALMGINGATLFPGLDTSCGFLRSRMFAAQT